MLFRTVALLVVTAPIAVLCHGSEQSVSTARTIARPPGTSIRSLLRPSDEVVILRERMSAPPLDISFPSEEAERKHETDALADPQNALFLIRVESVDSSLNSDETWINSTVRMRILEVLSSGPTPVDGDWGDITIDTQSRVIAMRVDGGEIRMGKTIVSAGDYLVWESSRTYLVSCRVAPVEKAAYLGVVYEVDLNQKLVTQRRSRGSESAAVKGLNGRNLDEVRKLVAR